jgi:hypothetical protein
MRGLEAVLDGSDFAAVGDYAGMLIIVFVGRTWFPTDGLIPETTPLGITIDAPAPRYEFSCRTVLHQRTSTHPRWGADRTTHPGKVSLPEVSSGDATVGPARA